MRHQLELNFGSSTGAGIGAWESGIGGYVHHDEDARMLARAADPDKHCVLTLNFCMPLQTINRSLSTMEAAVQMNEANLRGQPYIKILAGAVDHARKRNGDPLLSYAEYWGGLALFFEKATRYTDSEERVAVIEAPPLSTSQPFQAVDETGDKCRFFEVDRRSYAQKTEEMADRAGVIYIPTFVALGGTEVVEHGFMSSDGVHTNGKAGEAIHKIEYPIVQRIIERDHQQDLGQDERHRKAVAEREASQHAAEMTLGQEPPELQVAGA